MGFMAGKKALIVGVASDRSIAAGIAEAFAREGAKSHSLIRMTNSRAVSRSSPRASGKTPICCFPAMSRPTRD